MSDYFDEKEKLYSNKQEKNEEYKTPETNNKTIGQEIQNHSENYTEISNKYIKDNKKLVVSVAILFICLFLGLLMFFYGDYYIIYNGTYKSVVPISTEQMKNSSVRQSLDILVQQDNDLTELIKRRKKVNIDNLFEVFYNNLVLFAGKDKEFKSKLNDWGEESKNVGIKFKYINKDVIYDNEHFTIQIGKIITPKTDIFKMLNDGEGGYCAGVDYNYLYNQYSKNLSKPWQEFLALKKREFQERDGCTYYQDGYPPAQKVLVNWVIDIDKFLNKYPDFAMNGSLKENYKIYVSDMMRTDIFDNKNLILSEIKKSYEKFLSYANKNTGEYKEIRNWYNALRKNSFKYSADFYKYLYELDNNKNNKDTYERIKIIENYENLKIDKKEFTSVYEDACNYCNEHMDSGSGSYELCIKDLFEKQGVKYLKIYNTTWAYCSETHDYDGLSGVRECLFKAFDNFKQ